MRQIPKENWRDSEDRYQRWEQNLSRPIVLIGSCVNHFFRGHNKEADHWASVGASGKKEIVIDEGSNTEK